MFFFFQFKLEYSGYSIYSYKYYDICTHPLTYEYKIYSTHYPHISIYNIHFLSITDFIRKYSSRRIILTFIKIIIPFTLYYIYYNTVGYNIYYIRLHEILIIYLNISFEYKYFT